MHPLMRKMTAEFIGTFGLIFFGGGAAAMGKPLILNSAVTPADLAGFL